MSDRESTAALLRDAAEALDRAAAHCRIAADHLDEGLVPRMGAHAFAARGDLDRGRAALDAAARAHATHASIGGPGA
jgi:hypothetical protein